MSTSGPPSARIVGRVLSPALCDQAQRQCRQYTDKQLFLFAPDTASALEVRRAPLGLTGLYPTAEAGESGPAPAIEPWPLVPASLLALLGLLLLVGQRCGVRPSPYTI